MKLDPRTFRIEFSMHAWTGVIVSLLLFVMSYCGIFALFHEELHEWEDPAFATAHAEAPAQPLSLDRLLAQAQKHVTIPHGASIGFSVHEGARSVPVWLSRDMEGHEREFVLDAKTGAIRPQHSGLAEELYVLHFFYRVPLGMQLSGLVSVALLVALISGLLTHLKDLVRKWWVFRPHKRLRTSANDAHVALGIFTLPFALMIAWSGALLCLATLLSAGLANTVLGGDLQKLATIRHEEALLRTPTEQASNMLPLDELLRRAGQAVPDGEKGSFWFGVDMFGDKQSYVRAFFPRTGLSSGRHAYLQASDGRVLKSTLEMPAGTGFERTMTDLHYGNYGGVLLKALYTLLALGLCAIVITGNLMWLERRDPRREHVGNRLLERLMAGTAPGLVFASAVYFLANRLLPAGDEARPDHEYTWFVWAWGLATVSAFVPRWSARAASATSFALASVLFLAVIAFDVGNYSDGLLRPWSDDGMPNTLVIALLLLGLALSCAATARVLFRGVVKAAAPARERAHGLAMNSAVHSADDQTAQSAE